MPARVARGLLAHFLILVGLLGCGSRAAPQSPEKPRIVSLTPAITETLVALGAEQSLVGISDFCQPPAGHPGLPRVGTTLVPRFEAIALLRPTLIATEPGVSASGGDLGGIGPVRTYPWLSLDEVVDSTRALGEVVGRASEAQRLIARYRTELTSTVGPHAPRVLLALAHSPGRLSEVWFVRPASLHGAVLAAAGANNAVTHPPQGAPHLGLEQVMALDPDVVIILDPSGVDPAPLVADWQRLSGLRAARSGRVTALSDRRAQATGPSILEMVAKLRGLIATVWSGS
jgi:ABC-type Fe3+-hydroxamate transport system substrate-binding protein